MGGGIRDLLIGRPPADLDLAVEGDFKAFGRQLASTLNSKPIILGKNDGEIVRVIARNHCIDISALKGGTIEADLQRRDFTVNAMAYDPVARRLIDPFDGFKDLQRGVLRASSDTIFSDDPVRLLRAYRLCNSLDLKLAPQTRALIKRDASMIQGCPGERLSVEMSQLMASNDSHPHLLAMADDGLLFALLPELGLQRGCMQNQYHRYDVFEHTMAAYQYLEKMIDQPGTLVCQSSTPKAIERLKAVSPGIKWSILLHDIGKPLTRSIDPEGCVHFYRHETVGADIAAKILQRLRLSNKQREYVTGMIRLHLQPLQLFRAHCNGLLKRKGLLRFYRRCGPRTFDLLVHGYTDAFAKGHSEASDRNQLFFDFVRSVVQDWFRHTDRSAAVQRLINGQDLIHYFKLRPSPDFKRVLNAFEVYQAANPTIDRQQALEWVSGFLKKRGLR